MQVDVATKGKIAHFDDPIQQINIEQNVWGLWREEGL